jgi:hypothetical protein
MCVGDVLPDTSVLFVTGTIGCRLTCLCCSMLPKGSCGNGQMCLVDVRTVTLPDAMFTEHKIRLVR